MLDSSAVARRRLLGTRPGGASLLLPRARCMSGDGVPGTSNMFAAAAAAAAQVAQETQREERHTRLNRGGSLISPPDVSVVSPPSSSPRKRKSLCESMVARRAVEACGEARVARCYSGDGIPAATFGFKVKDSRDDKTKTAAPKSGDRGGGLRLRESLLSSPEKKKLGGVDGCVEPPSLSGRDGETSVEEEAEGEKTEEKVAAVIVPLTSRASGRAKPATQERRSRFGGDNTR